jgi:hypothetical protein
MAVLNQRGSSTLVSPSANDIKLGRKKFKHCLMQINQLLNILTSIGLAAVFETDWASRRRTLCSSQYSFDISESSLEGHCSAPGVDTPEGRCISESDLFFTAAADLFEYPCAEKLLQLPACVAAESYLSVRITLTQSVIGPGPQVLDALPTGFR